MLYFINDIHVTVTVTVTAIVTDMPVFIVSHTYVIPISDLDIISYTLSIKVSILHIIYIHYLFICLI